MNLPFSSSPLRRASDAAPTPPTLLRLAASAAALLVTLLLGRMAAHRFDSPVNELAVTGALRHVLPDDVRMAAAPLLDAKLFELDIDALRAAVEQLPWVAHARVDRQWPGRIAVRITEREPFARWGGDRALSTEGVVFSPGTVVLSPVLPRLNGTSGRELEVMTVYGQLADRLSDTPFALAGLEQDARGEWTATTTSGISLRLGRDNPQEQAQRLKSTVQPALATRLSQVQSIDLRYANGFAVGWRDPNTRNEPMAGTTSREPAETGATP